MLMLGVIEDKKNPTIFGATARQCDSHLMSSSVTMKALQSGWAVFSHTPGFFSTAADSWPVMGAELVCRALAIADNKVLSVHPGPTPTGEQIHLTVVVPGLHHVINIHVIIS